MRTSRRFAPTVAALLALAVGAGAQIAVGAKGHSGGPRARTSAANPVANAAEAGVSRLQRDGVIDAAQLAAVDRQIAAGSVDPKQLVDTGVLSEAQMRTVADAVDAAKAAG